jgi:vacuolar protein 8
MHLAFNGINRVTIADGGAIPRLVRLFGLLGPPSRDVQDVQDMQQRISAALGSLAQNSGNQVTIAAAGGIPPLVRLLVSPGSTGVQVDAAGALLQLAANAANRITIATAGAIPLLVQLLGPTSPAPMTQTSLLLLAHLQTNALGLLANLSLNDANRVTIASVAIPRLVQLLLKPGSPPAALVQQSAAQVLRTLAENAWNSVAIRIAGAIPLLVQLLVPGSSTQVLANTAGALHSLAQHADNPVTIVAAGGIPPLVRLLGPNSPAPMVQFNAARALRCLGCSSSEIRATIALAAAAAGTSANLLPVPF